MKQCTPLPPHPHMSPCLPEKYKGCCDLTACTLKKRWWSYSLTFPLCINQSQTKKSFTPCGSILQSEKTMNAQIPVELWTGHCVGTTTTSIVGSISKPIASIFLNEEHFLTLDKEVRNLYSFSPLKSSDQWQTSRSVRSKLFVDVNSHHGQQIRFVETRLKGAKMKTSCQSPTRL